MKKLKQTIVKAHSIFREMVLRQNCTLENSVIGDQKLIEDIRLKSYTYRRMSF
jgi:hypothetical protein